MRQKANDALGKIVQELGVVGLSAAAARGSELIFETAMGMRDPQLGLPATTDTVYRLASVTKHISAMTLMTLVDEGKADLDKDIGNYLGYKVRNPLWPDVPLTLRQLMTHTSSLVEHGSYNKILAGELPAYKLSEVLTSGSPGDCPENWLPDKPGTRHDYSSFGSGVMGAVAECITGIRFSELVHQRIFGPLDLDASLDADTLSDSAQVAVPTSAGGIEDTVWLGKSLENKKKLMALPVGEAYRAAQGNGFMRARDLLTVTQVLTNRGVAGGVQILSEAATGEMEKVQFNDGKIVSGLNLYFHDHITSKRLIGHYGRAYGALAILMFDPDEGTAATVLCNGAVMTPDGRGLVGNTLFCTLAMQALWAACFSRP